MNEPLRITADGGDWSATYEGLGTSSYCCIRDVDGKVVALAVAHSLGYDEHPDCLLIARRIVHCVNAHVELVTAGGGTDCVDNKPAMTQVPVRTFGRMLDRIAQLEAALQKLVEKCDDSDDFRYGTLSTSFVRDIASAAIAKATGVKQ